MRPVDQVVSAALGELFLYRWLMSELDPREFDNRTEEFRRGNSRFKPVGEDLIANKYRVINIYKGGMR